MTTLPCPTPRTVDRPPGQKLTDKTPVTLELGQRRRADATPSYAIDQDYMLTVTGRDQQRRRIITVENRSPSSTAPTRPQASTAGTFIRSLRRIQPELFVRSETSLRDVTGGRNPVPRRQA